MKILFITNAFAPDEYSESIVNNKLVLALKDDGHLVTVITRKMYGLTYSCEWNEPWISLKGNTIQVGYLTGNKIYRLLDYIRCSIKLFYPLEGVRWIYHTMVHADALIRVNKYDLMITRSPSDIPHIVGLKLKKKYNIPWIANWNDPSNGILPKPYSNPNKIISSISHYFTQKVLLKADFNIFPCDRLRSYFIKYYKFDIGQSAIIPHIGISILKDKSETPANNNLLICHAGSLSIERDSEILLANIAKINRRSEHIKIYFIILGIADQAVYNLINKYSLNDEVFFIGSKPYLDSLQIMQKSDVLCIIEAKMVEGIFLPSKLSDYIVLNKPVLCLSPPSGTLVDLISEFGGGLVVNNEDEESVYDGLKKLIELKRENRLFDKYYSKNLTSYLSKNEVLKKYEMIFNKIVKI